MDEARLLDLAREAGFGAQLIDTAQICFDAGFLKYCEENKCGNYGANYSCPPDCGTPDEMRARVMRFSRALVLTTRRPMPDFSDLETFRRCKLDHNRRMLEIIHALRAQNMPCLMCGASNCALCERCAIIDGHPCVNPQDRYSCLSAYCVNVSELAKASGMAYSWNQGEMTLYGIIAF